MGEAVLANCKLVCPKETHLQFLSPNYDFESCCSIRKKAVELLSLPNDNKVRKYGFQIQEFFTQHNMRNICPLELTCMKRCLRFWINNKWINKEITPPLRHMVGLIVWKILHSGQCINEKIQDSSAGLLECRKINCDWGLILCKEDFIPSWWRLRTYEL